MEKNNYKEISLIGQGAFGKVYKALDKQGNILAIKHIKFQSQQQGIPSTALRQITLLKSLKNHPNIVPLKQILYKPKQKDLRIVFDYYEYDLKKYLHCKQKLLNEIEIRIILKKILNGLEFCHYRKVVHRDMKPQNILIDENGNVKLGDFGLSRLLMIPNKTLTHEVQTLWYRAPEILLGDTKYTFAVDIWAVGCIFAEMFTKYPFFQGNGYQIEQIFKIFYTMGTPNANQWLQLSTLPEFKTSFPKWKKQSLATLIPQISQIGIDLLQKMLELNPNNRISASKALQHEYLQNINI